LSNHIFEDLRKPKAPNTHQSLAKLGHSASHQRRMCTHLSLLQPRRAPPTRLYHAAWRVRHTLLNPMVCHPPVRVLPVSTTSPREASTRPTPTSMDRSFVVTLSAVPRSLMPPLAVSRHPAAALGHSVDPPPCRRLALRLSLGAQA
jgi:hypothetical protein